MHRDPHENGRGKIDKIHNHRISHSRAVEPCPQEMARRASPCSGKHGEALS